MIPRWTFLHPRMTTEHLGELPYFLNLDDDRDARTQINEAYPFGGWTRFEGFTAAPGRGLAYPGDPTMHPIAECMLREERVVLYPHSWVAIWHGETLHSVARID